MVQIYLATWANGGTWCPLFNNFFLFFTFFLSHKHFVTHFSSIYSLASHRLFFIIISRENQIHRRAHLIFQCFIKGATFLLKGRRLKITFLVSFFLLLHFYIVFQVKSIFLSFLLKQIWIINVKLSFAKEK